MAGNSAEPGRTVTSKLSEILLTFSGGGEYKLTEIARSTNLPTSTTHRLVAQMVTWRLLERTEDYRYRASFPLRMMANDYSKSESCSYARTVIRAMPVIDELSAITRTEAALGMLRGTEVLTLRSPTHLAAGGVHAEGLLQSVVPAHASAAGKALLAFSPPRVVDEVIAAALPSFTRHTITSVDVLRSELSVVKLTQTARSVGEFELDRSAIACPVFFSGGRVAAAVELTYREPALEVGPATSALLIACRSLSRRLATDLHRAGST